MLSFRKHSVYMPIRALTNNEPQTWQTYTGLIRKVNDASFELNLRCVVVPPHMDGLGTVSAFPHSGPRVTLIATSPARIFPNCHGLKSHGSSLAAVLPIEAVKLWLRIQLCNFSYRRILSLQRLKAYKGWPD